MNKKLQDYIRRSSGEVTHLQNVANRTGMTDNIKRLIAKRNKGQEAASKRLTGEAREATYGADYNLAVQNLKAKAKKNPVDFKSLAARMQAAYAREDAKKKQDAQGLKEDVSDTITDNDDRRKYNALRSMQSDRLAKAKKSKDLVRSGHEQMAQQHGDEAETILDKYRKESTDICKVCGQTPCNCTSISETAAWSRKEGKNPSGGLNRKGIESYRRENPGSKLSMAVTTPPSKLDPDSKAAKRRKSFCARMGGMEGAMKKPNGEPTRKALALKKWNCNEEVVEEGSNGLWDNIHAKRERIKNGSGEKMRKPGSKGAPTATALKMSAESNEHVVHSTLDTIKRTLESKLVEGANVRAGNPKAYSNDYNFSRTGFSKTRHPDGGANDEGHPEEKPKFKSLMDRPHTVHIDGKPWKTFNNGHQANAAANTLNAKGKKAVAIANFKEMKEDTDMDNKTHPDAIHVKPVKVDGQTKYHVHAVGANFSHGIKKGEHLTDTELDDFAEMGGKIKHLKEQKLADILSKLKV